MTRAKPDGVPPGAWWSAEDGEWVLAERDDKGRMQGVVAYWRPDGTLVSRCSFVDGVPDGRYERYHENGEVSRSGTFVDGRLGGVDACFRSTGETTEMAFPVDAMPDNVWRYESVIVGGRTVSGRWYDKEGRQVTDTGKPLPERPGGVPDTAVYFSKSEYWAVGDIDGKGEQGLWRYWSTAGEPLGERDFKDGTELERRWFLGPKHGEAVVALRAGRVGEAFAAAREFWDAADTVEEVVMAGSVLADVLAAVPGTAANTKRRELLARIGEAGDHGAPFTPEGRACYRAQSRALGWLAAIKLDDGEPQIAAVLSHRAVALEHHYGPCAARVTLFHALVRLGMTEAAFEVVRGTLDEEPDFPGFSDVVAEPAYIDHATAIGEGTTAMTVADAWGEIGPGRLPEIARIVSAQGGGPGPRSWPIREVLGERLSPELDAWLDLADGLPDAGGEFFGAADASVGEAIDREDGCWVGRLEGLFLPMSAVMVADEVIYHASWTAGTDGLSQVYYCHQDEAEHFLAHRSLAGLVAHKVAADEDFSLRPVFRERWNRVWELLRQEPEPVLAAHLDVLALADRLEWVVEHLLAVSGEAVRYAEMPGTAVWEAEREACRTWPHLQAYWLLHHLVMGNTEELPELLEYAETRYPPVDELAGIARSVVAGGEPDVAWWDAGRVARTRSLMFAANPSALNEASRERMG